MAKGLKIKGPLAEVRLYNICKDFNCLPEAGGWYDQDPEICWAFNEISSAISEYHHEEEVKQKRASKVPKGQRRGGVTF